MKTLQVKQLIEKIEGEADLDFSIIDGSIEGVKINFGFYRGIEEILVGKDPKDALVITPRVCGICNHAHLLAAVRAIEDGYHDAGLSVTVSSKAKDIRDFTLACELLQNHMKWFYMTMYPNLEKLIGKVSDNHYAHKATSFASTVTRAMAIFSGQWPHSSYAVPGGVTCDPTHLDIIQAQNLIENAITFFEEVVCDLPLDAYLQIDSVSQLYKIKGDFGRFLDYLDAANMKNRGKSHDRFIVFGDCSLCQAGKSNITHLSKVDAKFIEESEQSDTVAKAVGYKNRQYEVGPLARGMVAKNALIKSLHKQYKDSLFTRIFARVHEMGLLLDHAYRLLKGIKVEESSCTLRYHDKVPESFEGIGVVEAARGSLIHKVKVAHGKITHYEIITPTQWNLSHGLENEKGIAVEAMRGSNSIEEANFIFRAFDVCSVCTAH